MTTPLKQKYETALAARGWTLDYRSQRVRWTSPVKPNTYIYLGRNGSVRIGRNLKESHPIPEMHKMELIAEANKLLRAPKPERLASLNTFLKTVE